MTSDAPTPADPTGQPSATAPADVAGLLAIDRRVLAATAEIVAAVHPEQLTGPTPCAGWSLRDLLGHMIVSNLGFAAAADGAPVGGEVWDSVEAPDDVFSGYLESAAAVSAAFTRADPDVPVPVFGYGTFPLTTALRMHVVDFVVHGWDVARAIGWRWRYDPELVEVAYPIMLGFRGPRPNKAFDVIREVPDDAPTTDRLMGFVGRDPRWTP